MNASDFIHKGKDDKRKKKPHKTTNTHAQNSHKKKKQPPLNKTKFFLTKFKCS